MSRSYYNARNRVEPLTLDNLFIRIQSLYELYKDKDYLKEKTGLIYNYIPDSLKHEAALFLGFNALPVKNWYANEYIAENMFSVIEFLFDRVSKPGERITKNNGGYDFEDYDTYDSISAQNEFRAAANSFLPNYEDGFELDGSGNVVRLGSQGLQYILSADLPKFDDANVDSKVRRAIHIWRDRRSKEAERMDSIRLLADVFEFLKTSHKLEAKLGNKDTSDLFNIANNFAVRHHNAKQKSDYDPAIWYSWIFHFYLATYHASVRLLIKSRKEIE